MKYWSMLETQKEQRMVVDIEVSSYIHRDRKMMDTMNMQMIEKLLNHTMNVLVVGGCRRSPRVVASSSRSSNY